MDNSTAAAMIQHLANHDQQIDQILGLFGHNATGSSNIIQEVNQLKQAEQNLQHLVNILTDEVHNLLTENGLLKNQLSVVNSTVLGRLAGKEKKHFLNVLASFREKSLQHMQISKLIFLKKLNL